MAVTATGVFWDGAVLTAQGLGALGSVTGDRVLNGCEMTYNSGTITISDGHACVGGRVVRISGTITGAPTAGTVYVTVTLNTVDSTISVGAASSAPSGGADINLSAGTYTGWIASIDTSTGVVTYRNGNSGTVLWEQAPASTGAITASCSGLSGYSLVMIEFMWSMTYQNSGSVICAYEDGKDIFMSMAWSSSGAGVSVFRTAHINGDSIEFTTGSYSGSGQSGNYAIPTKIIGL